MLCALKETDKVFIRRACSRCRRQSPDDYYIINLLFVCLNYLLLFIFCSLKIFHRCHTKRWWFVPAKTSILAVREWTNCRSFPTWNGVAKDAVATTKPAVATTTTTKTKGAILLLLLRLWNWLNTEVTAKPLSYGTTATACRSTRRRTPSYSTLCDTTITANTPVLSTNEDDQTQSSTSSFKVVYHFLLLPPPPLLNPL